MERKERLAQIRASQVGTPNTGGFQAGDAVAEVRGAGQQAVGVDHTAFLLEEIARLEAVNSSLVNINRDLAAEIENVKADFGSNQR